MPTTLAGSIILNNINAIGPIQVTDASTGATVGGITTNAGTQLVSAKQITLISTNNTAGSGIINTNGNVLAPIVDITSGTGSGINLGAVVGGVNAAVSLNANTANIIQTGSAAGALVDGASLTFTAAVIQGQSRPRPILLRRSLPTCRLSLN